MLLCFCNICFVIGNPSYLDQLNASFPDFFINLRHYTINKNNYCIKKNKQALLSRLGFSHDGVSRDFFDYFNVNSLKGQCHEIFCFRLFFMNHLPPSP